MHTIEEIDLKTTAQSDQRAEEAARGLIASRERLREKGLIVDGLASLSVRIPGTQSMAFCDPSVRAADDSIHYASFAESDARDSKDARLRLMSTHASVYRARPDVGAVAILQPTWSSALHLLDRPLPLVFDEQARQIGRPVVLLESMADGSIDPAGPLATGANAFLFGQGVLVTGVTREKAAFNCELLEKCARAYLLAYAAGGKIRRLPWFVRWIAGSRLMKDERRAAESYAQGAVPTGFTAY